MTYAILFFSALLSATIFPVGSEALLIYDIKEGYTLGWLIAVATLGNTLGSVINYYMGLGGEAYLEKKGVIDPLKFAKFKKIFKKYGGWSLLLSWTPFMGDLFTFAAGVAKYPFWSFLGLVFVAKLGRYLLLGWIFV